jgi:hypothetical protein
MDANSDGLPDHLTTTGILYNTGASFALGPPIYFSAKMDRDTADDANYSWTITDMLDVNGDGVLDCSSRSKSDPISYTYIEFEWEDATLYLNEDNIKQHVEKGMVDINGDGFPDLVRKHRDDSHFFVNINQGNGTMGTTQEWNAPGDDKDLKYLYIDNGAKSVHTEADLFDINGDGLPDHVLKHRDTNNIFLVYLNYGNGFGPAINWTTAGDPYDVRFTFIEKKNQFWPRINSSIDL